MNDEFEKLTGLSDDIVDEITEICPYHDDSLNDRIFASCERKMKMKDENKNIVNTENNDYFYTTEGEQTEVIRKTPWYRKPVFAVAASFLLVAGIGTAGILSLGVSPVNEPSTQIVEITPTDEELENAETAPEDEPENVIVTKDIITNDFNISDYPAFAEALSQIKDFSFIDGAITVSQAKTEYTLLDIDSDEMPELLVFYNNFLINICEYPSDDSDDISAVFIGFGDLSDGVYHYCGGDVIKCESYEGDKIGFYHYKDNGNFEFICGIESFIVGSEAEVSNYITSDNEKLHGYEKNEDGSVTIQVLTVNDPDITDEEIEKIIGPFDADKIDMAPVDLVFAAPEDIGVMCENNDISYEEVYTETVVEVTTESNDMTSDENDITAVVAVESDEIGIHFPMEEIIDTVVESEDVIAE